MATIWNRINTVLLLLVLFALLGVIAMLAAGVRGGPLDPPGAPASTDSVKLPGTPISSLPYTITGSGSYYLTRNLVAGSGTGITISADDVTLDLMGFVLDGSTDSSVSSGYGIYDGGVARSNLFVRNGTLRNWNIAINLEKAGRSSLDDLRVVDGGKGIVIGTGGILSRLIVRENGAAGVEILHTGLDWGTELGDSVISRNLFNGVVVDANNVWLHDNVIDSNVGSGVRLYNNASWNKVMDNRITGNSSHGVFIDNAGSGAPNANLVARNVILGNTLGAVLDTGTGNRIGTFVGSDASITATNPWSNVVY